MYYNGTGVIKNPAQAHAWWNIAGSQGFEEAKKNLASLKKEMSSEQKAEAMKLARELFARLRKK
jgi:TPR repeat protein